MHGIILDDAAGRHAVLHQRKSYRAAEQLKADDSWHGTKDGYVFTTGWGEPSCRIQDRIAAVRDAVTAVSDGAAARQLSERAGDVLGVPM